MSVIALVFSVRPAGHCGPLLFLSADIFVFSLLELGDHVQLEFQSISAETREGEIQVTEWLEEEPLVYGTPAFAHAGLKLQTIEKEARHERCSSPSPCTFHMPILRLSTSQEPTCLCEKAMQELRSASRSSTSISYLDVTRHFLKRHGDSWASPRPCCPSSRPCLPG